MLLNSCPTHRSSCLFADAGDIGLSCQWGRNSSASPTSRFLALPQAHGRAKGMIPELPHRDNVVQLTPPPPKQMPQRLQEQVYGVIDKGMGQQVQKPRQGKANTPVGLPMLRPKAEHKPPPTPQAVTMVKAPPAAAQVTSDFGPSDDVAETPFPAPVPSMAGQVTQGGDGEPDTPFMEAPADPGSTTPLAEDDTPVQNAHRVSGEYLTVIFGKIRVRFDVRNPCSILRVAGVLLDGIVAELNGYLIHHNDILMSGPYAPLAEATLVFRPKGLRGGAPAEKSEEAIRTMMSSLLQSKGLQGKALQSKLAEAFDKLTKAELVTWSQKGTWQALKTVVGTRITFLERQRRGTDPWTESDPWSEALASSSKDTKPMNSKPNLTPQISLIPDVWQNEDTTKPNVLERPSKGSTGISIMSPQDFNSTWASVNMPASPDELTVIVWPPSPELLEDIPHECVVFPARVHSNSSSVTLLRGRAYHLGAKRITLRQEASNEFTTKQAVSLLVELEEELVDKPTWDRVCPKPLEFIQSTLGKTANVLSTWGTRYWSREGKLSNPKECCRITTNILVQPEVLHSILKTSGRPLWIRGSLADCRRKQDTLMHAAGIVKGNRGFAVRIPTEHLDEAKKVLYPGQPWQPTLDPKESVQMYKVSPTPVGATQADVSSFLRRALPADTIQVRRQVGPTSWLIAVNGTIEQDFVAMKEGYLVLQEWRSGRNVDSFRHAVLVGNPRVLRKASEAVSFAGGFVPGEPSEITPNLRPPPQGPVQQLVADCKKETEDRITTLKSRHCSENSMSLKLGTIWPFLSSGQINKDTKLQWNG